MNGHSERYPAASLAGFFKPSWIVPWPSLQIILILGLMILGPLLEAQPLHGRSAKGSGKTLLIAAASNLRFAMDEIVDEFGKAFQAELQIVYGSSGSFTAQLMAGAPFDLFFSADEARPQRLISEGLVLENTLYHYGTGRIVLWVPHRSPLDPSEDGLKILLHPSVHKIAMANPRHAPYGAAAVAALQNAGLYEGLRPRLVFGENISEAAHFVRAGSAQIGILSYAHAIGSPLKGAGRFWLLPTVSYPPLDQAAIILGQSQNIPLARSFITFMIEGLGREILERSGYQTQGSSR